MTYRVKAIYPTIQGEGFHTGRSAVFVRFSGCNLWSGREEDRADAVCRFCDTDFRGTDGAGGGIFDEAETLAARVREAWASVRADLDAGPGLGPYVVLTGGEPLLQCDPPLIDALHSAGFEIGVETNGTVPAPSGIDWLVVSPKAGAPLAVVTGDELKLVYPQEGIDPSAFARLQFDHFYLMPLHDDDLPAHTQAALEYCRRHPRWRLTLQVQKLVGMP